MVGFRVFGRLSYGRLPASGKPAMVATSRSRRLSGMRLICADEWKAVRLHEDCFVLWEEEKRTAA
jgi:hypothetical protein